MIYQQQACRLVLMQEKEEFMPLGEQSDHLERLASLGQMSSIIAHEIRNPLGSIRLNLQYLLRKMRIPEPYSRSFQDIDAGIQRIEKVIHGILDFVRPTQSELQHIDLHDLLDICLSAWQQEQNGQKIEVTTRYEAEWARIEADPHQLERAFMNLLRNAAEATPEAGTVSIRTWNEKEWIFVSFEDEGPGIPKEHAERIFDPFYTTKPDGIGIGLAVVKRVLDRHRATIQLDPERGKGARFVVRFKCADKGAE